MAFVVSQMFNGQTARQSPLACVQFRMLLPRLPSEKVITVKEKRQMVMVSREE